MINVGTLALLTVGMASAIFWLPVLAMHQPGGDAGEAAIGGGALLLFSLVPLLLTIVTGVLYWSVDVESDREAIRLGLE